MGPGNKSDVCGTCGKKLEDCVGHFGNVRLALPVYHAGFLRQTYQLLQCLCKAGARLRAEQRATYRLLSSQYLSRPDELQKSALHKRLIETCKKIRTCPHCGIYNATLKKRSGVPLMISRLVVFSFFLFFVLFIIVLEESLCFFLSLVNYCLVNYCLS
ncbi:unnamed protein product [Polarella glacialis]|uniref:DNA-directed RNA polymerase n=1 Tax=Polarella glacialis TaxID=89957 RepID=A0A813EVS1_POLGL|nr:unnamed protein product [Polarella glacialis]